MSELQGQKAELRFTVEITRKETGLVEKYDLIGHLDEDKLKELQNGSNTHDSSPQRCD
jgi:hypothetical protein